jgi:predicted esterase
MRTAGLVAISLAAISCARSPAPARARQIPVQVPPAVSAPPVAEAPPPPALPSLPTEKQTLRGEGGHVVEVYPPLDATPKPAASPLVVFLHATCMEPADVCDFWSRGGRDNSFLVCPAGPSTCYGAPDWSGTPRLKADTLDAALAAVDGTYGPWVDRARGDVLIGYSRGAFAARDILYERPGRFRGLILLSAAVSPDPAKLKAAGIHRVVMATGDLDGSRPVMRKAVATLEAAGIPTKFVSLGKIGHWLPQDLESILRDAIAWVELPVS